MCCIAYEHELYQELKKELPNVGQMVKTPSCECCKVVSVDYIKKLVRTSENASGALSIHKAEDVELIHFDAKLKDNAQVVASIDEEDNIVIEETIPSFHDLETKVLTKDKKTNNKSKNRHHQKKKQGITNDKTKN